MRTAESTCGMELRETGLKFTRTAEKPIRCVGLGEHCRLCRRTTNQERLERLKKPCSILAVILDGDVVDKRVNDNYNVRLRAKCIE